MEESGEGEIVCCVWRMVVRRREVVDSSRVR